MVIEVISSIVIEVASIVQFNHCLTFKQIQKLSGLIYV